MVGGKARGHSGEEGQRIDGEIEHQPAQKADAEDAENDADDEHGSALHNQVGRMSRAFHHHGAEQSIGEEDAERERKSSEASARQPARYVAIVSVEVSEGPCSPLILRLR